VHLEAHDQQAASSQSYSSPYGQDRWGKQLRAQGPETEPVRIGSASQGAQKRRQVAPGRSERCSCDQSGDCGQVAALGPTSSLGSAGMPADGKQVAE
jgi:hypothetical protein